MTVQVTEVNEQFLYRLTDRDTHRDTDRQRQTNRLTGIGRLWTLPGNTGPPPSEL